MSYEGVHTIVARYGGGVLGGEVVVPGGDVAVKSSDEPGCAVRLSRLGAECPAHFSECAVGFFVVASDAAGDKVFPRVGSATRFGLDVVDGVGRFSAVCAAVVVASENSAPGEGDAFCHRYFDVSGEDDDVGSFP